MFKVGDKVRRITFADGLTIGATYTISAVEEAGMWLGLEGPHQNHTSDPTPWHVSTFERVSPDIEVVKYSGNRPSLSQAQAQEKGINPKDLVGQKKVDLSLVPPAALVYLALAMEDGAKKYGPYNWRENKVRARVYLAAAMRHIAAKLDGEEVASDSQKPHLAHALACLAIYVDAEETGNLQDDRPTPGAASKLIAKWEKKPEDKKETA